MNPVKDAIKQRIVSIQRDADLLKQKIDYDRPAIECAINMLNGMSAERDQYLKDIEELKKYLEGLK